MKIQLCHFEQNVNCCLWQNILIIHSKMVTLFHINISHEFSILFMFRLLVLFIFFSVHSVYNSVLKFIISQCLVYDSAERTGIVAWTWGLTISIKSVQALVDEYSCKKSNFMRQYIYNEESLVLVLYLIDHGFRTSPKVSLTERVMVINRMVPLLFLFIH